MEERGEKTFRREIYEDDFLCDKEDMADACASGRPTFLLLTNSCWRWVIFDKSIFKIYLRWRGDYVI